MLANTENLWIILKHFIQLYYVVNYGTVHVLSSISAFAVAEVLQKPETAKQWKRPTKYFLMKNLNWLLKQSDLFFVAINVSSRNK